MASQYSTSAAMPATRKSMHRSRNNEATSEKISVVPPLETTALQAAEKQKASPIGPDVDARGYTVLKGADRFGLTMKPFSSDDSNDQGRKRSTRLQYVEGLRGILGLQVLLWTFFRIFAPAIVADRDVDGIYPAAFVNASPHWQTALRKVLSPLLFNGDLQAAFFIIISGRVSLLTFVERREAKTLAGAAFKRPFRFIPPVLITLALVSAVVALNGFRYAEEMSLALQNQLAASPVQWDSALEYVNSAMFYFFTPETYKTARAVAFLPPSGIMWFVPVLFQQTYVCIVLAFAIPYTVLRYKTLGLGLLILTTAWVGRWSWYTLTGLMMAEYSTAYLQLLPHNRIPLSRRGNAYIPGWVPGAVFVALGIMFKYLWIAAFPSMANNEIIAHVNGNTGKLNYGTDPAQIAYPRYDNWFLATGVLYLIELSPRSQRYLSVKPLTYIGRWSFSIALISGTVMLSLGSFLYHHFTFNMGITNESALLGLLFVILIPTSLVIVELYTRVVDDTTLFAANWIWHWIRV